MALLFNAEPDDLQAFMGDNAAHSFAIFVTPRRWRLIWSSIGHEHFQADFTAMRDGYPLPAMRYAANILRSAASMFCH